MVTWLPIFHDLGLIYGILTPLYKGFHCILMDPVAFLQKPLRWLQAISDYGGTHSHAPNFAYDLCVRKISDAERDKLDLHRWFAAINAAEPVRLKTMQRFAERFAPCGFQYESFRIGYGLAEASVKVSSTLTLGVAPLVRWLDVAALEQNRLVDVEPEQGVAILSCGHSSVGADIRIIDPESLAPCPPNRVGEVWVDSLSVAQGYWQNPTATEETFNAFISGTGEGPFLRTGDLGFLWRGELFITGRIKDLLIIRGRNVYPQDVELVAEQAHGALRPGCSAAFSIEQDEQEELAVVLELQRGITATEELVAEITTAVRQAISTEFSLQPHTLLLIEAGGAHKTSSGKIQRQATRAAFLQNELPVLGRWSAPIQQESLPVSRAVSLPSQTQIINWLCLWLAQKLDVPVATIQPTQPLADFGLSSVTAVELAHELTVWLGLPEELEATLVWNYPTITAVAEHLHQPPPTPELDTLSEAELTALLAAELGKA
jgi:acyl-CoA synthetase (AMP-forming)/AMP-acid ligase II/acyl carrier protein